MNEYKRDTSHCDDLNCPCKRHFVVVPEAAKLIRKSERTIYRWLEQGFLSAKKIKNGWLIKPEDLFKLLD